jgi:hypothetical protein
MPRCARRRVHATTGFQTQATGIVGEHSTRISGPKERSTNYQQLSGKRTYAKPVLGRDAAEGPYSHGTHRPS